MTTTVPVPGPASQDRGDAGPPADAAAVEGGRSVPAEAFRRGSALRLWALCVVGLGVALTLAVAIGSVSIPPLAMLDLVVSRLLGIAPSANYPDTYSTILFSIRLPRVVMAAITGAALASAGAAYQGLFRNPLADPYLVGVASGAGLGATLAIVLNLPATGLGLSAVPVGAFVGGLVTVALVVLIAQVGRTMPVATMLLAGVAIGSFASACTTFLMLRSPDGLRRAFNWLLGGYGGGGWQPVWIILPYLVLGLAVLMLHARALNILQLDEEQARQLGIPVERVKLILVVAATLMTAAVVAFGGLIGFVGLVAPHALRMLGGHDYRRLIPLSAVAGAAFLILADLAARTVIAPQELPVGVVTALTGAPFFIYLLRRLKRSVF